MSVMKKELYQPAEWETHSAVWTGWPCREDLWLEHLEAAQEEFVAFCEAIVDLDSSGKPLGETVNVVVPDENYRQQAEQALKGLPIQFHTIPIGDIWLRDTAPIFLRDKAGTIFARSFRFNGWGGKYIFPHDDTVGMEIARRSGAQILTSDWVLEGGSVDVDGEGTLLTSEQCLLNPNRNPGLTRTQIEERLKSDLGVEKVLWVRDGLMNDHTDGHIDTIARFVGQGRVICMRGTGDDPNYAILKEIESDLRRQSDAFGRELEVVTIPSPGAILDSDGKPMPASYVNFYISNTKVIVPTYGSPFDEPAVAAIAECFPGRKTVGLKAKAILTGGGAFHCITQQQPL